MNKSGSGLPLYLRLEQRGWAEGGLGGGGVKQIATESMSGEGKVQKKEQIVLGLLPLRQMESGLDG